MSEPLILSRKIMGGTFFVQLWTNQIEYHSQIINDGFDLIENLEDKLTDFRDSPFNRINHQAGVEPVQVDAETFSLIQTAQAFSRKTNGAFDISYASVGQLWRQARRTGVLPDEKEVAAHALWVNYQKIILDEKNLSVFLPDKKMRIGLGGIGKGYAVDKLFAFLKSKDIVNFLVDGSGDIRVHSTNSAPRPWKLGIRNPFSDDRQKKIGFIQLKEGAIATSGDYVNYVRNPALQRKFHHVIDPHSGNPTEGIASSTVIALSALEADLNATLLMLLGPKKGLAYLNREEMAGIMVKSSGDVIMSKKAFELMGGSCK